MALFRDERRTKDGRHQRIDGGTGMVLAHKKAMRVYIVHAAACTQSIIVPRSWALCQSCNRCNWLDDKYFTAFFFIHESSKIYRDIRWYRD